MHIGLIKVNSWLFQAVDLVYPPSRYSEAEIAYRVFKVVQYFAAVNIGILLVWNVSHSMREPL